MRRSPVRVVPDPDDSERRRALMADGAVSVVEAAKFLGASRTFLYMLMKEGRIPWARAGRKRVIPRRALVAYLSEQLVELGRS